VLLRDSVFGLGFSPRTANVRSSLRVGTVLASVPLLVAVYENLPGKNASYPYPLVDLVSFCVRAAASWLLYAFFLGYFFADLRGADGPTKAMRLFVALAVPLAAYHLLKTQSASDMQPFVLWAGQLFAFLGLIGLIGLDYLLLRNNGFQARDLLSLHHIAALSAFGSSLIAALVPAVTALASGRIRDLVAFFLNTVLPQTPQ
jgi:hypothetical protein